MGARSLLQRLSAVLAGVSMVWVEDPILFGALPPFPVAPSLRGVVGSDDACFAFFFKLRIELRLAETDVNDDTLGLLILGDGERVKIVIQRTAEATKTVS